ncbi:hypothetical protein CAEBREN_01158 [Caenorhabditis brenneri]|uniref:Uncharacterized protein n=1 Tax=Caenorhabditis brenneri TaxID=135651 RepID=G0NI83_CAEBE|nr:hypothetical protein CAEBREN_01158 [Caenorhabditis brenneri]
MALLILSTILIAFLTWLAYVIYLRREKRRLRKKIGLDGPEAHWFLGNLKDIIDRTKFLGYNNAQEWNMEMWRKYGDRFAIYFGQKLDIYLANEEDIKEVFIKNFSNFSDRGVIEIFRETKLNASLLQNTYENGWKHTRSAIAPIFATGKMKAMHETINSKIDTFLEILREKAEGTEKWDIYDFEMSGCEVSRSFPTCTQDLGSDQGCAKKKSSEKFWSEKIRQTFFFDFFRAKKYRKMIFEIFFGIFRFFPNLFGFFQEKWIKSDFQGLTLDVIGKCAFAIDTNCQRDRNDVFYVEARKFFHHIDLRNNPLVTASVMIPELMWLWKFLYKFSGLASAEDPLVGGLDDVYERRRGGEGADSVDLLKLLLDREDDKTKGMTKQEVIENCFAFLLAGYETTSTAMTYCSYLLAKYPDVQEKLYQEIVELKRSGKTLNYDSIHQIKYLDAVYKETLRYYPPVIHFISRTCLEDITIRDQFYPKGCAVTVQANTVHRSESNWENPDKFDPERFLNTEDPTKDGLKWIPFGVGPRYCVGMRFAEMEFKTTIAKLIEMFQLSVPEGEADLVPDCNGVIMRPRDPVRLDLKLRK